jgi:hypothetical protein
MAKMSKSMGVTEFRRSEPRAWLSLTLRHANGYSKVISQALIGGVMKKKFLKCLTMLLGIFAVAFVTAVASNAQSSNSAANKSARQLVADIPFEFSIDYKTMPAGEYVVQTVATAGDGLLIQSAREELGPAPE